MTSIAATSSSLGDTLAAFIAGSSELTAVPAVTPAASSTAQSSGLGPATVVDLSDPAKAAVTKAQSDQAAAARLQAYVEAHSVHGNANGGSNSTAATQSDPFQSLLDEAVPAAVTTTAAGSPNANTAIATIQSIANAETAQPYVPFTPTRSLSTSLNFAGYTVTVNTNASTQYYGAELNGNGLSTSDKHFGPSAGFSGGGTQPPGVEVSTSSTSGDEVTFTITSNTASASGASIASSNGSAATAQSVSAQSSTVTFVVNYATGQIQASQSAASIAAQSTLSWQPGSLLSALA